MDEMKMATFRISQMHLGPENGKKEGDTNENGKGAPADGKTPESKEKEINGKENSKDGNGKDNKEKSKDKAPVERISEYTLPDGNTLNLEEEGGLEIADLLVKKTPESGVSITYLVYGAITRSDVDIRRDLYGGVVITGGTSMIPGVVERITPQAYKLKVIAPPSSIERTCASWIGGAIVSSLGTFQQVWISKAEYDELGSVTALRNCP